jgi:hypothetical protein
MPWLKPHKEKKMSKRITTLILATKYFLQGDPWEIAWMNAKTIVRGFRRR